MTTDTDVAEPAPPAPPARTTGDRVRFVARGLGQTLITAGFVVLLFVVYEVWVTNIFADRNNERNISSIKKQFEQVTVGGPSSTPTTSTAAVPVGKGIGVLYIPRFGRDYAEAIVQGDRVPNDDQLEQGVAHYGTTQLPGQVGNFAVAGHRVGKGEPFLNMDLIKSGDTVVVETKSSWFVYSVLPMTQPYTDGIAGREIIRPDGKASSGFSVLNAVPDHAPNDVATKAYLTMTTCHPKFTAEKRMIVHAVLVATIAPVTVDGKRVERMPEQVSALYDRVDG